MHIDIHTYKVRRGNRLVLTRNFLRRVEGTIARSKGGKGWLIHNMPFKILVASVFVYRVFAYVKTNDSTVMFRLYSDIERRVPNRKTDLLKKTFDTKLR